MTKTTKAYEPKDPGGLAGAVIVWLWIYVAGNVLGLCGAAVEIHFLLDMDPSAPMTQWVPVPSPLWAQATTSFGALTQFVTFNISAFLVLKWIYRSSRNAHALASGLKTSPPWAIGWYFVPVATWWKPFGAMAEIWKVSANPLEWRKVRTPALLRWWWGLWIVSALIGNISFRINVSARRADSLMGSDGIQVIYMLLEIALCLVLMPIVRRVSAMQVVAIHEQDFE